MKKSLKIMGFSLLSATAILAVGCKKKSTTDLSSTYTTAEPSTEKEIKTTAAPTAPAQNPSAVVDPAFKTQSSTYQSDNKNVSIAYPKLAEMQDTAMQEKINALIEKNATSIVSALGVDPTKDKLDIQSSINNSDNSRLSIIYKGTLTKADGSTQAIFYTNTIDLKNGQDLGLKDFADAETMAKYLLSDDIQLSDASADVTNKFLEKRKSKSVEDYTNMLKNADFPVKSSDGKTFPSSFSYQNGGDIYFTVPVDHDLGDYVTVIYSPKTK
jgi:hypothetical protein